METHPLSASDAQKIQFAAWAWAYQHKCKVKAEKFPVGDGVFVVRVTLVNRKRERMFV